jgi:hypothetical protein
LSSGAARSFEPAPGWCAARSCRSSRFPPAAHVRVRLHLQSDIPSPVLPAPRGAWRRNPPEEQGGAYERYTGDASVPGKGELLVWNHGTARHNDRRHVLPKRSTCARRAC